MQLNVTLNTPQATPELVEWFQNGFLTLMVFAKQEDAKPDAKLLNLSTKELRLLHDEDRSSMQEAQASVGGIRCVHCITSHIILHHIHGCPGACR